MTSRDSSQIERRHTVGTVIDSDNYNILSDSQGATIIVLETTSAELEIALILSMPLVSSTGLSAYTKQPEHDRLLAVRRHAWWSVDVEVQAILTLFRSRAIRIVEKLLCPCLHLTRARKLLNACWLDSLSLQRRRPRRCCFWRTKPFRWRLRKRYSEVSICRGCK